MTFSSKNVVLHFETSLDMLPGLRGCRGLLLPDISSRQAGWPWYRQHWKIPAQEAQVVEAKEAWKMMENRHQRFSMIFQAARTVLPTNLSPKGTLRFTVV